MCTVIVLPGLDGTGALLEPFVAAAPPASEPHLVRYPCHERLDYGALDQLIESQIPAEGPIHVIGESFSGPLAVMLAARHQERVRSLVLVASFVRSPAPWVASLVPWNIVFRLRAPDWALRRYLTGPEPPSSLLPQLRSTLRQVHPKVLAARVRAVLGVDVRRQLAECRAPLLYLQATSDRLIPVRCAIEATTVAPQSAVATVPGSHLILQHSPERAWQLISEFVGGSLTNRSS